MAYDTRQITHGTQEVTYGLSGDGSGVVSYSTGVQKFSPSVDQDSKKIYADSKTHMTLLNAKTLTIDQDNLQYTPNEMTQMGYLASSTGFTDNGNYPKFAVQRILNVQGEDGNVVKKLEVYYGVTSGAYTESDDEDEDEINPKVYSRTLNVDGFDFGNGLVKQFIITRTTANATVFDTYKTKILKPADFKSVVG
jgi:hypothetical protein